jgi:hypothetical protein
VKQADRFGKRPAFDWFQQKGIEQACQRERWHRSTDSDKACRRGGRAELVAEGSGIVAGQVQIHQHGQGTGAACGAQQSRLRLIKTLRHNAFRAQQEVEHLQLQRVVVQHQDGPGFARIAHLVMLAFALVRTNEWKQAIALRTKGYDYANAFPI